MIKRRCAALAEEHPGFRTTQFTPHDFRRPYVTHLIEDGWDPRFVQEQVGHEHASTTSIYTCVSSDFRKRTLRRHLDSVVAAALASPGAQS
ncbi:tyrosine-type recombinase/integrase [Amycolatopsis sp. PS_44_ISF1]|uniref:tyrosine-type recombinase/integrase n=1 Tax=Amycolatopsis sp. PS_44_ISF1 TaxID=2974917 RepID=UPI0028DDBF3A|nr:tyrosine-type recombinase/integrase [Amycolatopsis sp. PS_44_ISF1]MDT8913498.1 site-specific integrase [Amycolatopsis sp. PS_44_ISF1]